MILLVILNLLPIRRMLRRLCPQETRMPDDQDENQRPKAEAEKLTRDLMKRMLSLPPKPHEKMKAKKKSKSRKK
jgi:hypothetical protein